MRSSDQVIPRHLAGQTPAGSGLGSNPVISSADQRDRSVAGVIGATVAAAGAVSDAFGVIGSGNLIVTNALCAGGARFHHARHEGGAICMADGYARVSGRLGVCSVHQGPGLTNTLTGLTEAVKSRTPLLVLAGEAPSAATHSNFRIDADGLIAAVGAIPARITDPASAAAEAARAVTMATAQRRPVVLLMPVDVQAQPGVVAPESPPPPAPPSGELDEDTLERTAAALEAAHRPLILAGRGAVVAGAGPALRALGERCGALLATSAPAHGLFTGDPAALGISGGFASPAAARLIGQADLVLLAGASANHWTTRHGRLLAPGVTVVQIDEDPAAFGRHVAVDIPVSGDVRRVAERLTGLVTPGQRWRATRQHLTGWRSESFTDAGTAETIDPRTLSIELERRLPEDRVVALDSGHLTGWPAMYLTVPDARRWVFTNGFQAVGLGLGNAIGAAIARPGAVTVAALGDGGTFMALPELETAARLGLRLLVVVYDDRAYGAEVHHFAPLGHDVSRVQFPDADLAAIARATGCDGATVRSVEDLAALDGWLAGPADSGPLVLDCKVSPDVCAEWLSEAFRGG
jgi:thiamine pyrophosphate-dependent acetolactate synthase large subunit-like protein